MRSKLLSFLLIFALLFTQVGASLVVAAPDTEIEVLNKEIADRKDKIKQLEETIEKYKKNIVQKQTQAQSLKNQLAILDNRIAQVEADVELSEEKIGQASLEIEALQISIKDKEQKMDKQKNIIAKMVGNIHAADQKNYLEVMLTYDSFADFYSEIKYIENVYVDLGRSVKTLRLAKEDLNNKKQQVEAKKKVYEDLKEELEVKKETLKGQVYLKEKTLVDTKSSERTYQTLLSSLKQQYQVIESEQRTFEDRLRKKLEAQDKLEQDNDVAFGWPATSRVINSFFRDSDYPFKQVFQHSGIDIRASHGTPIKASASGYVAKARRCSVSSCYAYVLIVHTSDISTLYGHLSKIMVDDDQFVNKGDVIGYSGGTPGTVGAGPFVTGPHLHFEVRKNGIPVDPLGYVVQ